MNCLVSEKTAAAVGLRERRSNTRYVRAAVMQLASTLPLPLRNRLREYYEQRVRRSSGLPMMGEQILDCFAGFLGIENDIVDDIAYPWAWLYIHCLLIDDLMDIGDGKRPHDLMLSQILIDHAYGQLRQLFGASTGFWQQFSAYRMESWRAMLDELRADPYTNTDKYQRSLKQGRKAAMAKGCAAALVYRRNNVALSVQQERGIDALCAGVQLLDDVADFEEDVQAHRQTYLVQQVTTWLAEHAVGADGVAAGRNQLRFGLVLSGAVKESWDVAALMLESALELLNQRPTSRAAETFALLITGARRSASVFDNTMAAHREHIDILKRALCQGEDAITRALQSKGLTRAWEQIEAVVRHGPKAAN